MIFFCLILNFTSFQYIQTFQSSYSISWVEWWFIWTKTVLKREVCLGDKLSLTKLVLTVVSLWLHHVTYRELPRRNPVLQLDGLASCNDVHMLESSNSSTVNTVAKLSNRIGLCCIVAFTYATLIWFDHFVFKSIRYYSSPALQNSELASPCSRSSFLKINSYF